MALWQVFDGKDTRGPFTDEVLVDLIHKGLRSGILIRREGDEEWKPLAIHAPFALAVEKAEKAQPPARPKRKPLGLAGGVVLVVSALLANTFWFSVGVSVDATCSVRGYGATSCLFTNHGLFPGSGCVVARATRLSDHRGLNSQRVCSGVLLPRGTTSVETSAAFTQSPASFCDDGKGAAPWTDQCDIDVIPAP